MICTEIKRLTPFTVNRSPLHPHYHKLCMRSPSRARRDTTTYVRQRMNHKLRPGLTFDCNRNDAPATVHRTELTKPRGKCVVRCLVLSLQRAGRFILFIVNVVVGIHSNCQLKTAPPCATRTARARLPL